MWSDFYQAGGWGMIPTTIFGVLLVAVSLAYAAMPERRLVPLLVSMSVVVLGSGCLGCVTGFITTFRFIQQVEAARQHTVTLLGISESLNNVVLAFIFLVLSTLIASIGALRLGLRNKAAAGTGNPA